MIEIAPRITLDPATRHGRPVIKGTRVPVTTIVGHLGAGWSAERVIKEFAITMEDMLAALQYAARRLEEEEIHAVK